MLPRARRDHIIVRELPRETLVYDLERHTAHCLNEAAAIVWRHCDGRTTIREIAAILEDEVGVPVGERVVWFALDRLRKARLLSAQPDLPARLGRISRRQALKGFGAAASASILLPAVLTIVAPRAEAQVSCLPSGSPCTLPLGTPCCLPSLCNPITLHCM